MGNFELAIKQAREFRADVHARIRSGKGSQLISDIRHDEEFIKGLAASWVEDHPEIVNCAAALAGLLLVAYTAGHDARERHDRDEKLRELLDG